MPIHLVIRSGPRSGESFVIEREQVRIGSDPRCEISLPFPGLAPHSVTIEQRSGNCRISNRMDRPVSVGGRTVTSGNSAEFGYGEEIDLAGAVVLSLEQADEPAIRSNLQKFAPDLAEIRNERAANEDLNAGTDDEPQSPPKADNSNTIQMAVIIFCFSMIPLLFIAKAIEKTSDTSDQKVVTFEAIRDAVNKASESTAKALASETDADASDTNLQTTADQLHILQGFIDQLRLAKAHQLRGNPGQANLIYDKLLKEILVRQKLRQIKPSEDADKPAKTSETTTHDVINETEEMMLRYTKRRRGS